MITKKIPLERWLELELRGMREFIVVDRDDYLEITAQPGWENVAHLEPINGQTESSEGEKSNALPGRNDFSSSTLVSVSPQNQNPSESKSTLFQLWPRRDWQQSIARLKQQKQASEIRVNQWNDRKEKLEKCRLALVKTGKYSDNRIKDIIERIEDYPSLVKMFGL